MLFSPVYTEAHPRRNAADAASCFSSNSFAFYPFRTLASHLKLTVSSNSFGFRQLRTLCKIPGIGYPPLVTRHSPLATRHCSSIPFLFSLSSSISLRRGPTGSLLSSFLSSDCGRFPSQQGGTPPSPTEYVSARTPSTHALCLGASVAVPPMMYPVPGFSAGSHLLARKRRTGIHRREAQ
jgi:hypothetical protein